MKQCIAVRHLAFEDLGYFEQELEAAGYRVSYVDAPRAERGDIERLAPDLLVVLGAPLGANDEADYPFLASELKLLESRLQRNLPTLGICLGAQLMARALGAPVTAGNRSEIGWLPMTLSAEGKQSPLRHFETVPVFHWHSDVFELPVGTASLASTPDCPQQAFSMGRNILGLQFHPEVTATGLESWYVGHYRSLQDPRNPNVSRLREDASRYAHLLRKHGSVFLAAWLSELG